MERKILGSAVERLEDHDVMHLRGRSKGPRAHNIPRPSRGTPGTRAPRDVVGEMSRLVWFHSCRRAHGLASETGQLEKFQQKCE
jgi:hypothetical protein